MSDSVNPTELFPIIFENCPRSLKSLTLRSTSPRGLHVLYARVDLVIGDPFFDVPALTNSINNNNLPIPIEWEAINPSHLRYSFTPFFEMLFHCPDLVPMDIRPSGLDGSSSPLSSSPSPSSPSSSSPSSSLVIRLFVAGSFNHRDPGTRSIQRLRDIQRRSARIFSAMMNVIQKNTLKTAKLTRYEGMEEGDKGEEEEDKRERKMDKSALRREYEMHPLTKTEMANGGRTEAAVVLRRSRLAGRKPSMRHFECLRRFAMHKCHKLESTLLLKVLFDCLHLENFNALATPVRLEDVIEREWVSTGIQELHITINTSMIQIPVGSNNRSSLDEQQ